MINPDINRFLGTLLYPIIDPGLLFDDPLDAFFSQLPEGFISPGDEKNLKENKEKVFFSALKYIAKRYPLDTHDQICQYMERWYLGRSVWRLKKNPFEKPPSLYDVVFYRLRQLSRSMISKLDGQIIYKYWQTEEDLSLLGGFAGNDKIHLFRGLNQLIPMDLLVSVFLAENPDAKSALHSFYGLVSITDAPLERVLSQGVAENHLHMGAATGFSLIWEDLMCPDIPLSGQEMKLPLNSPGAPSKSILYFYWLLARSLRMYLSICTSFYSKLCTNMETKSCFDDIQALLPNNLKALYQFLQGNSNETDRTLEYFQSLEQVLSATVLEDPSSPLRPGEALTEPGFLLHMFSAFSKPPTPHLEFQKRYFLYYLRLKHSIFHLIVQAKTISGLDYFQLYYTASSGLNKTAAFGQGIMKDSTAFLERQLRSQLSTPNIRYIEFRTSFFDKEGDLRNFIACFLKAYRNILGKDYCIYDTSRDSCLPAKPFPRVGIVFHFLKSSQETPDVCFRSEDQALLAYSELHSQYDLQLEGFKKLRDPQRYPGIDRYLVGIDVASLENSVPTWVFRDLYEKARDAKSEPFTSDRNRPFQSLGFTFHAGEDFRHLLSGLRRVYEVVHFLKFHAGDRLGHGLALGISVDDWCAEHPNVLLPRIEALENYLWAYRMLSTYPSDQNTGNLLYLERRIQELSGEIYCDPIKLEEDHPFHIPTALLLQSYEGLFSKAHFPVNYKQCIDGCEKEDQKQCPLLKAPLTSVEDILTAYHCYHYTKHMNEPIHYHLPPQEILILKELQAMLQQYISKRGVIVEINPSSNVVIGNMDTIHQHPVYQLSSYHCDYKNIMICINSDDPGVFQTNTANELGIAYMGMIERGIGRESCLDWIERLRKSGIRGSFIRRNDSDKELLQELDQLIKAL